MSLLIYGITLILLSLVAVPSLILAKKPNAKELLDKVAPYQGWAGVVFCIWGVWGIISCIMHLNMLGMGMWFMLAWILAFAGSIVEAVLGFMLGYNLIVEYALSKNETAKAKGEQILAKLTPLQGKFGILGLIVGAACIAWWAYVLIVHGAVV